MKLNKLIATLLATAGAMGLLVITLGVLSAQAPGGGRGGSGGRGGGGRGGGVAPALFAALDANKDGVVTRDEMKTAFDSWFTSWDSAKTAPALAGSAEAGLNIVFPESSPLITLSR